jgi:integrase
MTVKVNIDNFDKYFKRFMPDMFYDHIMSEFMFCLGCRPVELLNLGTSSFDLDKASITFTQAKCGLLTTRDIDPVVYDAALLMFRTYGNPKTYYGSYGTLQNYLDRIIEPKQIISNRLDKLYPLRYCACAELLLSKATHAQVYEFFNHENTANTDLYIAEAELINAQMPLN